MGFALNIFQPLVSHLPHVQAWWCYQAEVIVPSLSFTEGKKSDRVREIIHTQKAQTQAHTLWAREREPEQLEPDIAYIYSSWHTKSKTDMYL